MLNYKKPMLWIIVVLIIIVTAIGIGLATNPKVRESDELEEIKSMAWVDISETGEVSRLVEGNLEIIMSSPGESSNPYAYIKAHQDKYENIKKNWRRGSTSIHTVAVRKR